MCVLRLAFSVALVLGWGGVATAQPAPAPIAAMTAEDLARFFDAHAPREMGKEIKPHRDRTRSFYLEAPGGQAVEIIAYPPKNQENEEQPTT